MAQVLRSPASHTDQMLLLFKICYLEQKFQAARAMVSPPIVSSISSVGFDQHIYTVYRKIMKLTNTNITLSYFSCKFLLYICVTYQIIMYIKKKFES